MAYNEYLNMGNLHTEYLNLERISFVCKNMLKMSIMFTKPGTFGICAV